MESFAWILFSTVLCILVLVNNAIKLDEKFAWKQVNYVWPTPQAEADALRTGRYIPKNNLPLGVERWRNKIFITVPRWKSGVPSTLNYIDFSTDEISPRLIPYPSWEANTLPAVGRNRDASPSIVSAFRVQADVCDRLWMVDTGLNDVLGNPTQVKPNSILIYDLKTDQLLRHFTIPKAQIMHSTFLANIIVDASIDECDNAHAYIPDLGAYGVIVYSLQQERSWRVKHNFFHFDPLNGDFNVGGVNFQWTDGIFSLTLGYVNKDGSRNVYFHALASTKEFVVNNRVLQNETRALSTASYYDYRIVGDRGDNSQSTAEDFDPQTGVIFYTQVNKDAIACWNVNHPYTVETQGLVDSDSNSLIFPNDLKVDGEGRIWILSDRLPQFVYSKLNEDDVNFRVLTGKTRELIAGTPCARRYYN